MAGRKGYGQVEPNHLSAQATRQIYAQLPAKSTITQLENGQFAKYDIANGEVNFDGDGEFMLVYNEIKLYDVRQFNADYAMTKADAVDGVIVPRLMKTNIGDIMTTNTFEVAGSYRGDVTFSTAPALGDKLTVNANGFLEVDASPSTTEMVWKVVKVYTLADGQFACKIQRIQ